MKLFLMRGFSGTLTSLFNGARSPIPDHDPISSSTLDPPFIFSAIPASGSTPSLTATLINTSSDNPRGLPTRGSSLSSSNYSTSITPWEDRLFDIFPPGLGSKSESAKGQFYPIAPFHLHNILLRYRGSPLVQRTIVKSAWYGKQTKSARHEFIIIHVEDTAIPGLKNCMAIDRNQGVAQGKLQNLTAVSSRTTAFDTFKVSYDGDEAQLLHGSQLTPHLRLEEVTFQDDDPLLLQDLVALVHYISGQHDRFHALDTNCYWFTGLIWECMCRIFPKAQFEVYLPGRRGKIGLARIVPNPVQVRNVLREIRGWTGRFNSKNWQDLEMMSELKAV